MCPNTPNLLCAYQQHLERNLSLNVTKHYFYAPLQQFRNKPSRTCSNAYSSITVNVEIFVVKIFRGWIKQRKISMRNIFLQCIIVTLKFQTLNINSGTTMVRQLRNDNKHMSILEIFWHVVQSFLIFFTANAYLYFLFVGVLPHTIAFHVKLHPVCDGTHGILGHERSKY